MARKVKNKTDLVSASKTKSRRRNSRTTISAKNQVTIPVAVLREAGIGPGDQLAASVDGRGRVVFEAVADPFERFDGVLTGAFDRKAIESLRDEWD